MTGASPINPDKTLSGAMWRRGASRHQISNVRRTTWSWIEQETSTKRWTWLPLHHQVLLILFWMPIITGLYSEALSTIMLNTNSYNTKPFSPKQNSARLCSRDLNVPAEFSHLPSVIIVSFVDDETRISETHFVKCGGQFQLKKCIKYPKRYCTTVKATGRLKALFVQPLIGNGAVGVFSCLLLSRRHSMLWLATLLGATQGCISKHCYRECCEVSPSSLVVYHLLISSLPYSYR